MQPMVRDLLYSFVAPENKNAERVSGARLRLPMNTHNPAVATLQFGSIAHLRILVAPCLRKADARSVFTLTM